MFCVKSKQFGSHYVMTIDHNTECSYYSVMKKLMENNNVTVDDLSFVIDFDKISDKYNMFNLSSRTFYNLMIFKTEKDAIYFAHKTNGLGIERGFFDIIPLRDLGKQLYFVHSVFGYIKPFILLNIYDELSYDEKERFLDTCNVLFVNSLDEAKKISSGIVINNLTKVEEAYLFMEERFNQLEQGDLNQFNEKVKQTYKDIMLKKLKLI